MLILCLEMETIAGITLWIGLKESLDMIPNIMECFCLIQEKSLKFRIKHNFRILRFYYFSIFITTHSV